MVLANSKTNAPVPLIKGQQVRVWLVGWVPRAGTPLYSVCLGGYHAQVPPSARQPQQIHKLRFDGEIVLTGNVRPPKPSQRQLYFPWYSVFASAVK
jgi:hypothetical protein